VTPGSAEALASRLNQYFKGVEIRVGSNDPGYRLVVNGTPLGMSPDDPLPLDVRRLAPTTTVADVVMKPT
jgi:shikimate dehydrogenase